MKLYTDRFETTLPAEVRERFRCEIPLVEKPRPLLPGRNSIALQQGKKTPWVLLCWSAIIVVLCGICLAGLAQINQHGLPEAIKPVNRYPHLAPTPVRAPPASVIIEPAPTPAPVPIPTPASLPSVWKTWKPVPRAELVQSEATTTWGTVLGQMPDGSVVRIRILGDVNTQEELPLSGNHFGDAYRVDGIPFVWTRLTNGHGVWIDPQIIPQ